MNQPLEMSFPPSRSLKKSRAKEFSVPENWRHIDDRFQVSKCLLLTSSEV
ncbi:uncharacterized protein PHALS_03545 [Plasmopara halstedii]|uniref:Uncharacterized protein n=1 Tax=Plasmopara halstedii TaxID=4781 RepID=A0A0P1AYF9_PLAHL|nr:uncharacterized protein PHALS_03545 [Plasmopara halstedii]CEG46871.1 hypothetical protein PHALS_03545 [Plasmopara halstedii]|eukprot:XP_024583240.1 hypothetical protein PHALS_03545 [Plasmopara halstedii]